MASLNIGEKAKMFDYILTSDQIALVLEDAKENKKITEQEKEMLVGGREILDLIINGATLIEGKEFKDGVTPSIEGLSLYGYALSIITELTSKKIKNFTGFFQDISSKLDKLIDSKKLTDKDILLLEKFFDNLANLFRGAIKRDSNQTEKIFPTPLNGYTYA